MSALNRLTQVRHHRVHTSSGSQTAPQPPDVIAATLTYLPILERKPGALRNGVPFQQWDLPAPIRLVRDRILKQPKGDRAFVEMLMMAREFGLEPLQVACELVLDGNVITAPVVMNEMRRLVAPTTPIMLDVPDMLKLQTEPLADCGRYDRLRGVSHAIH